LKQKHHHYVKAMTKMNDDIDDLIGAMKV